MNIILETVPNFSEGRDLANVEQIADCFRGKEGVKLLDYSSDKDHNRSVFTVIGEPGSLRDAVIGSAKAALDLSGLRQHSGQH